MNTPVRSSTVTYAGDAGNSYVNTSAVSWGAILAGATAAAAMSLILLVLGTGLGLSVASPWGEREMNPEALGITTIIWILVTSLVASGIGGYLAGRLRTKWQGIHTDEVYFRDTAHGLLAWAIATLATAALLTSAIGVILGKGIQAGTSMAQGIATGATIAAAEGAEQGGNESLNYFMDTLFRKPTEGSLDTRAPASSTRVEPSQQTADTQSPAAGETAQTTDSESTEMTDTAGGEDTGAVVIPAYTYQQSSPPATMTSRDTAERPDPESDRAARAEIGRIFVNSIRSGSLPEQDLSYVASVIVENTGITQQEAEARIRTMQAQIQELETKVKETAEEVRKASAKTALWMFVSLLVGAFLASLAATFGGRQRDL